LQTALSDIELWSAFKGGDREAFSVLFRRFYPLLFQYGGKISRSTEVLEDAIQELFLELWQNPTSHSLRSVKAYLLQALKFKLYKNFRQRTFRTVNEMDGSLPFELSQDTLMVNKEVNNEQTRKLYEALEQLSPRQREVIYLKIYKGLSYEEVSEVMEINYQVVRNLLCTTLKSFKKICTVLVIPAINLIF
jgi:RNA polymerase sigma factor (sigma-70 family)